MPGRPAGEGIALTLSSVSEDSEEEEADALTERVERAWEEDRPLPRFPPERDLSVPDECLRHLSGWEDSLAHSHQLGEAVTESAPSSHLERAHSQMSKQQGLQGQGAPQHR